MSFMFIGINIFPRLDTRDQEEEEEDAGDGRAPVTRRRYTTINDDATQSVKPYAEREDSLDYKMACSRRPQ